MAAPISLAEARQFLRATDSAEDGLISLLVGAAQSRIEAGLGVTLSETSPAPLRLAVLLLAAQAYENRTTPGPNLSWIEAWLSPYRPSGL